MSKVAIVGDPSGTGTFTISAPNGNTDRTLVLPDEAGTVLTSASSITQNSGPAFMAYTNAGQAVSHNSNTKLTFATEEFDTDSCYDTSNSRFTPNVAGYYYVYSFFSGQTPASVNQAWTAAVYKNGGLYGPGTSNNVVTTRNAIDWGAFGVKCSQFVYCNGTTDYIEIYAYQYDYTTGGARNTYEKVFGGYMVRAA